MLPVVFVDLAVPAKVRDNGELAPASLNFAREGFLASVAIHVRLQGAGPGEAFVANLALVLLLRGRRYLGAKLAHHRLGRGRDLTAHQTMGPRQCASRQRLEIGAGC